MTFKPDRTYRKLAGSYRNCAYVYQDGVEVWEKRTVRSGQYEAEISITHIWPCQIKLRSQNGNGMVCKRLVIHNVAMLLSGLESANVYYNNSTESCREKGVHVTTVTFTAPNGMVWHQDVTSIISGDVCPQPNMFNDHASAPDGSILSVIKYCQDHGQNYEVHGVLPVQEGEQNVTA